MFATTGSEVLQSVGHRPSDGAARVARVFDNAAYHHDRALCVYSNIYNKQNFIVSSDRSIQSTTAYKISVIVQLYRSDCPFNWCIELWTSIICLLSTRCLCLALAYWIWMLSTFYSQYYTHRPFRHLIIIFTQNHFLVNCEIDISFIWPCVIAKTLRNKSDV